MKRFLAVILLLLLAGCSQSQADQSDLAATPIIVVAEPEIQLSETRGGPNTAVDIRGTGFPSETWVVVRLGTSPVNLSQSYAQVLTTVAGTFETSMIMPTAWDGADLTGQTELIVVAETADQALRALTNFTLQYDGAFQTYENTEVGFAVDIPLNWTVTEPQTTPLGEMILLGLGDPTSGDPAVSTILVADSTQIRPAEAVNLLQCGTLTCQERVSLGITEISGLDARQAMIGTDQTPNLEWFFINYNGRLVYFSLHDPITLQALDSLIKTFRLIEQQDISELAAVESTPEPTETAVPTATEIAAEAETEEDAAGSEEAEATETIEATATETAVPTETSTPEPTNTPVPSSTPTAEATEIPVTPTETAAPTATPPDPFEAGPVQTVIDFLEIILAQNVTTETLEYFSLEKQEDVTTTADIQNILSLGFAPSRFAVNRIPETSGVLVAVEFSNSAGSSDTRYFSLIVEQDRWRVDQITENDPIGAPPEEPTAEPEDGSTDPEATPEATSESEDSESSEETTPTATATAIPEDG